jgi:hypothetical protein
MVSGVARHEGHILKIGSKGSLVPHEAVDLPVDRGHLGSSRARLHIVARSLRRRVRWVPGVVHVVAFSLSVVG